MANTKEIFARHYDRIIAVIVLALLLFSLLYLVLRGMEVQQSLSDDKASFDPPTEVSSRGKTKIKGEVKTLVDKVAATQDAVDKIVIKVPANRKDENDVQPEDLFTSQARYLCEVCRLPIMMTAKTCTYATCKKPQTLLAKNEKLDLSNVDSDNDGMVDKWEIEYGLNPNSPEDADTDLDDDGISNVDEYLAKTNPKDPASHPDYTDYMSLVNLEKKFLLLRVVKTSPGGLGLDENGKSIHLTAIDFVEVSEDGKTVRTFVRQLPGQRIANTCYRYQAYNEKPSKLLEYETKVKGATSTQKATMPVNQSTTIVTVMSDEAIETYEKYVKTVAARESAEKEALVRPAAKETVKTLQAQEKVLKEKDAQFAKKERETQGVMYELAFYDEKYYKNLGTTWSGEPLMGLTAEINVDILPQTLEIKGLSKNNTFKVKDEEFAILELDETKESVKIKRKKDDKAFELSKK